MTVTLPLGGETPVIAAGLRGGGCQAGSPARTTPERGDGSRLGRGESGKCLRQFKDPDRMAGAVQGGPSRQVQAGARWTG